MNAFEFYTNNYIKKPIESCHHSAMLNHRDLYALNTFHSAPSFPRPLLDVEALDQAEMKRAPITKENVHASATLRRAVVLGKCINIAGPVLNDKSIVTKHFWRVVSAWSYNFFKAVSCTLAVRCFRPRAC